MSLLCRAMLLYSFEQYIKTKLDIIYNLQPGSISCQLSHLKMKHCSCTVKVNHIVKPCYSNKISYKYFNCLWGCYEQIFIGSTSFKRSSWSFLNLYETFQCIIEHNPQMVVANLSARQTYRLSNNSNNNNKVYAVQIFFSVQLLLTLLCPSTLRFFRYADVFA